MDAAVEAMRKSGLAKADKKAGRVAAEGKIVEAQAGNKAVLVEINSETDFVAKDENFVAFANAVAKAALSLDGDDVSALVAANLDGQSVEEARQALIAKIGENIQVRRMTAVETDGVIGSYVHGGRIGVLVELDGGDEELAPSASVAFDASIEGYLDTEAVTALANFTSRRLIGAAEGGRRGGHQ